jgi:hypothetical protein
MTKTTQPLPPALKHGAYSNLAVLPGEDPAAFKKLRESVIAEFNPGGPVEEDVVETIVRLMWRKQNLQTYGLADIARARLSEINERLRPDDLRVSYIGEPRSREQIRIDKKAAEAEAKEEFGHAPELIDLRELVEFEKLQQELSLVVQIDGMIDRSIKRLLMLRGIKSLSPPNTKTESTPRVQRLR